MSKPARSRGLEFALLALILAFAMWTRLGHSERGLPYLHHVDEPHTSVAALEMMKSAEFNPERFNYGTLNVYMMLAVDAVHYVWLSRSIDDRTGEPLRFEDIQPVTDPAWRWETSHPSFYRWNRGFCALLGSLTVLLVYLIGRRFHPIVGLVAAAVLALNSIHIRNSGMVAPDVPAAFFSLLTVALSVTYLKSGRTLTLVWAFITVGLGIAIKYNLAPVLIVPYLALGMERRNHNPRPHWLWWGGVLVSLGAFFLCVPYALLDLPTFLTHVGNEVRHYSVIGHGPNTIEGGWVHMSWALQQFAETLSWPGFVLALGGVLLSLRTKRHWILYSFPVVYLLLQTQMVVAFHRNLLSIYPYLALGIGVAAERLIALCDQRVAKAKPVVIGAISLLLIVLSWSEFDEAQAVRHDVETRTQTARAVAEMAEKNGWKKVGIESSLRIHPRDLALIDTEIVVEPLPDLRSLARYLDALVVPVQYDLANKDGWNVDHRLQRHIKRIPTSKPIWTLEGGPCYLGSLNVNPGVQIFVPPFNVAETP